MKICQNIDLVQLKVQSNLDQSNSFGRTFYLPKNVSWANETVEKIVIACPRVEIPLPTPTPGPIRAFFEAPSSPIDGSYIYNESDFHQKVRLSEETTEVSNQGIYFDIYKKDGSILCKDLSVLSLLSTNNNVFEINAKLDLEQTCIHVPGKLVRDGVIWLYVFYGGHDDATWQYPTENITVTVPLSPRQRLSFSDIINNYVHIQPNKIRGIYVWKTSWNEPETSGFHYVTNSESAVCVTLRNFNKSYIVNNVIDCVLGMPGSKELADIYAPERKHLFFDHDIDFDNSYIENLFEHLESTATIIFEY